MAILNYNGKSKSSGVYVIFNNLNWRVYVGSCKEFKTRWSYSCGHLSTLQKNVHKNKFLQADYNKCKLLTENDDFLEFHILEDLPNSTKAERLVAEEKWIAIHYGNRNRCYNMVKKPTSSEGCIQKTGKQHHNYGRKASEETKEKLRKAMLERKHLPNPNKGRKLSEEHRLKIIERLKGNKYSLGYVHSAETLKKRRVATLGKRLGIPLTEEHKKKLSEAKKGKNHFNYGKSLSEETKRKIGNSNKGKRHSAENCKKFSETRKGKKASDTAKKNISDAIKKHWELRRQRKEQEKQLAGSEEGSVLDT